MNGFSRYAIYYAPEPGSPLAEFGADWLGWDSATAQFRERDATHGVNVDAITSAPRRYGFHGTIKPPFRLASGTSAEALNVAFEALCSEAVPIALDALKLARLGRFLALVPMGDTEALAVMAAGIVRHLDCFRAPPTEAELAKRRLSRLNPQQEANLSQWGYPYVMDQFRFHMTLTGPLNDNEREAAQSALEERIACLSLRPYTLGSLVLIGEAGDGMFHQLRRLRLSGH